MREKRIEVAVAVLLKKGRVWIQQRRGTGHLDGLWEFPGGKVGSGETALQALLREVKEETRIDLPVQSTRLLQSLDYSYPERRLRLHFFLCRLDGPDLPDQPGSGLWVKLSALGGYAFPPANQPILDILKKPQSH